MKLWKCCLWSAVALQAQTLSQQIIVDQFGFRPNDLKVAIIANPIQGQNSGTSYVPGTSFELHKTSDNTSVFTGSLQVYNSGTMDANSGDEVWWADFSSYTTPGKYYVYDPTNNTKSYDFLIADTVYNAALKHATRMFFYQRCGFEIDSAHGGNWHHHICHLNDSAAVRWTQKSDPTTARDVHGGWHDAGDVNKYVPFTGTTLWDLLTAYENNPTKFGDDWGIPESGNGIADVLDEVKWEMDWVLRMQLPDGSVAGRVAENGCDKEGQDPAGLTTQRVWTEPSTWSTSTAIVDWAHGARIYRTQPGLANYADTLLTAAKSSWTWLLAHPTMYPATGVDNGGNAVSCGSQAPGDTSTDRWTRVWAAAELWKATGDTTYKNYFESHWVALAPLGTSDPVWDPLMNGNTHNPSQAYAAYTYITTAGANATLVAAVKTAVATLLSWQDNTDITKAQGYRNNMWYYAWGSNHSEAVWGFSYMLGKLLGLTGTNFEANAEEYLHWIHGRNPLSYLMLTNMGAKGAKVTDGNSIMQIYHYWFGEGSIYDGASSTYGPAPGFLSGGVNQGYDGGSTYMPITPVQKAYKDWNSDYPEQSWEVTEPGIYYQAAYVHLLSYFAGAATPISSTGTLNATTVKNPSVAWLVHGRVLEGSLNMAAKGFVEIQVVDLHGRTVASSKAWMSAGESQMRLTLNATAPGIYWVRTAQGNSVSMNSIVIR